MAARLDPQLHGRHLRGQALLDDHGNAVREAERNGVRGSPDTAVRVLLHALTRTTTSSARGRRATGMSHTRVPHASPPTAPPRSPRGGIQQVETKAPGYAPARRAWRSNTGRGQIATARLRREMGTVPRPLRGLGHKVAQQKPFLTHPALALALLLPRPREIHGVNQRDDQPDLRKGEDAACSAVGFLAMTTTNRKGQGNQ